MDIQNRRLNSVTRRNILRQLGGAAAALLSGRAWAQAVTMLPLPGKAVTGALFTQLLPFYDERAVAL
ncbi:MAG: hypothetical protein JWM91_2909 [Rhodospirillales bacterium]|nr:hypothetical protein [Rhodospirillales bacterium]